MAWAVAIRKSPTELVQPGVDDPPHVFGARSWKFQFPSESSLRLPPFCPLGRRGRSGRRGKGRRRWWTVEPGLPAVLFDAPLQLAAIIGAPPSSQVGEQSDSIPLTGTAPSARGKLGTYLGDAVHSVIQVLASVLQCEDGGPVVVRPVVYLEQEKKNPSRSNQRGYGHPRPRAEAVGRFCSWASSHPQRQRRCLE